MENLDGVTLQDKQAMKRAVHFAEEQRFSKSNQALEQTVSGLRGAIEPTEEVVEKLRKLHPPASRAPEPPPDSAPIFQPVSKKKLRAAGDRIANGSAADVFGWTGELIRLLLRDNQCGAYLAKIVGVIRDGVLPDEAREWLLASWLLALDKPGGRVRPIAGGTMLFKLAASYLIMTASAGAKTVFLKSGIQCGVFMPDGANTAAQFTQHTLDLDPDNIVIKVDFANAFNSLPRSKILSGVYEHPQLATFFRILHWAYCKPSTLLVRGKGGEVVAKIESEEGVRQGCVLGPLAFAVGTLGLLEGVKEAGSRDIEIAAF